MSAIIYTRQQATAKDIRHHLLICDELFIPPLSKRVDIDNYVAKIFSNAMTFEAWSDDQLIGLIGAYQNKAEESFFITTVSVLPTAMGFGVGKTLLSNCKDAAKEANAKTIKLEVNGKSVAAIQLYLKNGFIELKRTGDVITMELVLSSTNINSYI